VDQIGKQRDAAARHENDSLRDRRHAEHRKREQNRADALSRTLDAGIDETMRMPVTAVMAVVMVVLVRNISVLVRPLGEPRRSQVPVRAAVRVAVRAPPVPV
jgi:hypothetical protein